MKKPADMSPREYAKWLNETCMLPYDEACRMAGWTPYEEWQAELVTGICIGLVIIFTFGIAAVTLGAI